MIGADSIPRLSAPRLPQWRRLRRILLTLALVLAAGLAAYFLWLRDSGLVEVRDVAIEGATGNPAAQAALTGAAPGQSTLHFDPSALRAAVADDPEGAAVSATPDFPHGLRVEVELRRPVGYVDAGGGAMLAGDGTVLAEGTRRPDGLPLIDATAPVGTSAEGDALAAAQVLAAAPPPLAARVKSVRADPEAGAVAALSGGPELRFGDSSRGELKWRAAASVLADPALSSADYIDLSVPGRPVVG